ncbi:MAG: SMI1/KNR4 family protein [Planctomycetales bacterium]|nr:SMI1/KNR4 family protein [Planctomycetales bacterium]
MDDSLKSRIVVAFHGLRQDWRYPLSSERDLAKFESEFGLIPREYRWFLSACGGGLVGGGCVFGVAQLVARHGRWKFDEEDRWPGVFVVGTDGAGGSIGITTSTGEVVVNHGDHGIHSLAASFGEFLERNLLYYAPSCAAELVISYMRDHNDSWPPDWNSLQPYFATSRFRGWPYGRFQSAVFIDFNADAKALMRLSLESDFLLFNVIRSQSTWGNFDDYSNSMLYRYFRGGHGRDPIQRSRSFT